MTQVIRLTDELFVLAGETVVAGLLVKGDSAFLIDCHAGCTQKLLWSLGVRKLAGILLTQHRRDQTEGISNWHGLNVPVICSDAEADILEKAGDCWIDPAFRWRRFASLVPDLAMPGESIAVTRRVKPGETVDALGDPVLAVDAAGPSPGALAWLVCSGGLRVLFSGAAALAGGRLHDLWSLQKGFGVIQDYHGILGAAPELHKTLQRFVTLKPDLLVPAYGALEKSPEGSLASLRDRLTRLQQNIVRASALNHYFPELYHAWNRSWPRLPKAETLPLPPPVRYLGDTSFLLRSQDGYGFLIDCGNSDTADKLHDQTRSGQMNGLEGVWITHMHYDHTEGLVRLLALFDCPVYASRLTADTLCHPHAYFIPCQYPEPFPVVGLTDQTVFTWREFTLTSFEFPGQTLYHGGLLVEGQGHRILFAGDSFSSTGLDDYCPQNRVLPGPGRGMQLCLDRIRAYQPDCLINQHQQQAFRFTQEELDTFDQILVERGHLTEELTGRSAGWAWDDAWFRAVPFEQTAAPGANLEVAVHVTNHDQEPLPITAELVLPEGFQIVDGPATRHGNAGPLTSGSVLSDSQPDLCLTWQIRLPENLKPGETIRLPFRASCRVYEGVAAICLIHVAGA